MKITYKVLYKNGIEDTVVQEATEDVISETSNTISKCFRDDTPGILTLGDGKANGYFVRLDDVSRVKVEVSTPL